MPKPKISAIERKKAAFIASRNLAVLIDMMENAPPGILAALKELAYEIAFKAGNQGLSEEEFLAMGMLIGPAPAPAQGIVLNEEKPL